MAIKVERHDRVIKNKQKEHKKDGIYTSCSNKEQRQNVHDL